jgi:hypothetical protein
LRSYLEYKSRQNHLWGKYRRRWKGVKDTKDDSQKKGRNVQWFSVAHSLDHVTSWALSAMSLLNVSMFNSFFNVQILGQLSTRFPRSSSLDHSPFSEKGFCRASLAWSFCTSHTGSCTSKQIFSFEGTEYPYINLYPSYHSEI